MTLIVCTLAALIASALWHKQHKAGPQPAQPAQSPQSTQRFRHAHAPALSWGSLALAFWGASLMWCVDGIANLAEGEPFIELTDPALMVDDALLGFVVVAAALALWTIKACIAARHQTA